jgi:hypothetical protein
MTLDTSGGPMRLAMLYAVRVLTANGARTDTAVPM